MPALYTRGVAACAYLAAGKRIKVPSASVGADAQHRAEPFTLDFPL